MGVSRHGLTNDLADHVCTNLRVEDLGVAYQPIIDLQSGDVFAYETLLRSDDESVKSPMDLLARATETECIGELGRLVRQFATDGCPDAPLFINVHPDELNEGWLLRPDDPIFGHDHEIYLEITESVPVGREAQHTGTIRELRDKHIHIAIDDFGAGYSNLMYLTDLEPAIVKLDRAVINQMARGSRTFLMVEGFVKMCEGLGARVVAEGIETYEQFRAAVAAGAHFGQGYFISRPKRKRIEIQRSLSPIRAARRAAASTTATLETEVVVRPKVRLGEIAR